MLSERDKQFVIYWEREREKQSRFAGKLLRGLPMAVLFSLPVILLLFSVYLFFPEWYTKVSNTTTGTFITIIIALFICIIFFAYFRMHHKWEVNEQFYRELKSKEHRSGEFKPGQKQL